MYINVKLMDVMYRECLTDVCLNYVCCLRHAIRFVKRGIILEVSDGLVQ